MKEHTNWDYQAIEETLNDPLPGEYRTYGIQAKRRAVHGWELIELIHDVTLEADLAQKLAHLFRQYQLSPLHIRDVLDDMLP